MINRFKNPAEEKTGRGKNIINALARFNEKPMLFSVFLALILNLIVEMLSRRSVLAGFSHLAARPLIFTYNSMIILATLCVAMFVKKKLFAYLIISDIWLILGAANCVLLGMRTTPLGAIDFMNITTAIGVIKYYMNTLQIVLIVLLLLAVITGIVCLWFKMPRQKTNYLRSAMGTAGVAVLLFLSTVYGQRSQALGAQFDNLADAYSDYGFVYCFSCGLVDTGIDKPEGYSQEAVREILEKINSSETKTPLSTPNIVFLQLESFFDISRATDISLSENPIPVFTGLRDSFPSGFLTVPVIGAGTANTEFEAITGMSLRHFGPGEYPYKTILKDSASESVCYALKEQGYTTHAIHNNDGTFYQRNLVFPNLGFDRFIPIEYMYDVEYNTLGWAKDFILTDEIIKALDSTQGGDFIYAISVQGHGKYLSDDPENPYEIEVEASIEEDAINEIEFYLTQLKEMDEFLGELTAALSEHGENTVLVIYGDHLPKLDITYEFSEGDSFRTEYIIWSNFGLCAQDLDLCVWQLYSRVLGLLGIDNGVITKLNQSGLSGEEFEIAQNILQYDLLYGEKYAYGDKSAPVPTDMTMGTLPVSISSVTQQGDTLYVRGDGFNEWSKIYINGRRRDTLYITRELLVVEGFEAQCGDEICVAQSGDNNLVLGKTAAYIFTD